MRTNTFTPGDYNAVLAEAVGKCYTARGVTTGNSGDWKVAVPTWMAFFKQHLQ